MDAVSNVNDVIAPELIGMNVLEQTAIDRMMIGLDGTQNKSHLGANAILIKLNQIGTLTETLGKSSKIQPSAEDRRRVIINKRVNFTQNLEV